MQRIALTSAAVAAGGLVGVFMYPDRTAGEVKLGVATEAYKRIAWPILRRIDPESAHALTIKAAKWGLTPVDRVPDSPSLSGRVLGMWLRNPVGLAAGCDHNAEAVEAFDRMGFGFVEVGSVTPKPQDGTPKPRVFRLEEDRGVINRVGYANEGAQVVANRIKALRDDGFKGVLGVNLAFNRESAESPADDFAKGVELLGPLSDYLVINSAMLYHPPAPALRTAKHPHELQKVIKSAVTKKNQVCPRVPLLVKIHPDFPDNCLREVCTAIQAAGADGIIVGAPSAHRPNTLTSPNKSEFGGLSGAPVCEISADALKKIYSITGGKLPLIGVGGISSGEEAYKRIRAGASLVQIYTGLAYEGPYAVPGIKWRMEELARADGFETVNQAVGADVKGLFPVGHPNQGLHHTFSTWFSRPDSIV